ncbi:hypothetical protein ACA910_000265 [Epithemia clementina (nom. ined.)]
MSESLTVTEFKKHMAGKPAGLVIDIDETLSATNVAWFERLVELFGLPPEGLDIPQLIQKYSLAQNVPHWNSQEAALDWMKCQRDSLEAQKGLPLIPWACDGVNVLAQIVPILGYLTVRPVRVVEPTIQWLRENGFPQVPVIAKPNNVPFAQGNEWKGQVLRELISSGITGIVDDNPKVSIHAGADYPGILFLFGHSRCPAGAEHAIPCETWDSLVNEAGARRDKLTQRIRISQNNINNSISCKEEERALLEESNDSSMEELEQRQVCAVEEG